MGVDGSTALAQVPTQNIIEHQKTSPDPAPATFEEWLMNICNWAADENKAEESLRHRKWYRNERFYQGQHLIKFDARTGQVYEGNAKPEDPFYPNNQIRAHIKSLHKEVMRSNGEILIKAKSDDPHKVGGARSAKARLQDVQRREWTPDKKQEETQNLLLKGNSFRYDIWNTEDGDDTEEPTFEDMPMQIPGQSFCIDCGSEQQPTPPEMASEPGAQQPCSNCASPNVLSSEGIDTTAPVQTGTKQVKAGDLNRRVVPPEQVKLHLHARRYEDSPYLLWTQLVLKNVIDYTYRNVRYSTGTSANDSGLRMEQELERSPGYVSGGWQNGYYLGGNSGDAQARFVKLERFWFQPIVYAGMENTIPKDTPIGLMGDVLPAGASLLQLFPDGLYIARIGTAIVDIRNESFLDHWVHVVWDKIPSRIWGDAYVDDLIEPQKQINELDSLRFENFMWNAVLSKVYNPLKIERGRIGAKPGRWVPLKNPSLMDEPQKYIYQPEDHPIQGADLYAEEKRRQMQFLSGSFNPENGLPGAGGNTAAGMSILRDLVVSLISVPLELRSYADVKSAIIDLKLIQKNDRGERYIMLLSPYGEPEGQWFKAANIEGDYEITVKPHSWIPRSELERKQDVMEAGVACGIQGGVWSGMFPPEAKPVFIDAFNLPVAMDPAMADRRKCRLNIDKIVQGFSIAQQNGIDPIAFTIGIPSMDPMTGMPQVMGPLPGVPPQVTVDPEDEAQVHVDELKKFLKSDPGMDQQPEIKQVLRMLLEQWKQKAMMDLMEEAQKQMMMGPPPPGGPGGGGQGPPGAGGPPKAGGSKGPGGPKEEPSPNPKPKEAF